MGPCLQHLTRVFPNIQVLVLSTQEAWSETWSLDAEFIAPVAACASLTLITVQTSFNLSVSGLRCLCSSLRKSVTLTLERYKGVKRDELAAEVRLLEPGMVVKHNKYSVTLVRA